MIGDNDNSAENDSNNNCNYHDDKNNKSYNNNNNDTGLQLFYCKQTRQFLSKRTLNTNKSFHWRLNSLWMDTYRIEPINIIMFNWCIHKFVCFFFRTKQENWLSTYRELLSLGLWPQEKTAKTSPDVFVVLAFILINSRQISNCKTRLLRIF